MDIHWFVVCYPLSHYWVRFDWIKKTFPIKPFRYLIDPCILNKSSMSRDSLTWWGHKMRGFQYPDWCLTVLCVDNAVNVPSLPTKPHNTLIHTCWRLSGEERRGIMKLKKRKKSIFVTDCLVYKLVLAVKRHSGRSTIITNKDVIITHQHWSLGDRITLNARSNEEPSAMPCEAKTSVLLLN